MGESVIRKHMKERWGGRCNFVLNPPLPESLNIEINNTCNQRCVFCPFHGAYAPNVPKPAVIKLGDVKRILEEAKRLGIGKKEVGFYLSGEAFLHMNLPEIIAYAKELGFQYTFLTTNGALAYPEKMKAVLDAGLDSIRFSINAADRETYALLHGRDDFEVVVQNIQFMHQYIKENKLQVATSISCVLTGKTPRIENEMRLMFEEYVDDMLFIPVVLNRLECDSDFLNEYQIVDDSSAQINSEFVCSMLFNTLYINAKLEVVPCCEANDTNCVFYDLNQDFDLEKAWNCEKFIEYRKRFLEKADMKGTICESCMLRMKGVNRLLLD